MVTCVTKPQRPVNNPIFKSDPQTLPDFLTRNIHKVNTLLPLPDPGASDSGEAELQK
jgi:hypothetical protein